MDNGIAPIIIVWAFCALIGAAIGSKNNVGAVGGFFLGALLGCFGLIIVAVAGKKSTLDRVEAKPTLAGWHQDPLGRFDSRWFDGTKWTQHVGRVNADGSRQQFEDPL